VADADVLYYGKANRNMTMNTKLEQLKAYLTPLTAEQARAGLDGPPLPEVLSGEFVYALELDFRAELDERAHDYLRRKAEKEAQALIAA